MKTTLGSILCRNALFLFVMNSHAQVTFTKQDATCGQANGWAEVHVGGYAKAPLQYNWSNGGTSARIEKLTGGTYCVTITDANLCKGEGCVKLINSLKGLDVNVFCSISTWPKCRHMPPLWGISSTVSGGTPPYRVYPKESFVVDKPGTYGVTYWDKYGCKGSGFVRVGFSDTPCGTDPNAISGPEGYNEERFYSSRKRINYVIYFENDPELANAPAKKIMITHRFDPHVNIHSLRLGDFGFAGMSFEVPQNASYYQTILDLTDSLGIFAEVYAGLNVVDSTAFWIFQAIDPNTGLPPVDPMVGLLPVNDTVTNKGTGYVFFNVLPLSNTLTGDTLSASADIIFDINPPVITNTWINTADAFPPASHVVSLSPAYDTTDILIDFESQDDYMGSGVGTIDLYVSDNGHDYVKYGSTAADSTITFSGLPCRTYYFYSRATDHTGNEETEKTTHEAFTTLKPQPSYVLQPLSRNVYTGDSVSFTVSAAGTSFYQWEVSMDDGTSFSTVPDDSVFAGTRLATLSIQHVPAWLTGSHFRCIASNNYCYTHSNEAVLTIIGSLHGTVRYDNAPHSPITNSEVYIKTLNGTKVDSVITNQSGNYLFEILEPGIYITGFTVTKPWGGVNATDALLVLKHFAGLQPLLNYRLMVADVNKSNNVNAIDALLIAKRFAMIINNFETGDWLMYEDTIEVTGSPRQQDFMTLCYGDVNGSFIPEMKEAPALYLVAGEELSFMPGNPVNLPFSVKEDITACALSLILKYPADVISVKEVIFKNPEVRDNVMIHDADGIIRMAWYDLQPLSFRAGEILFELILEFIGHSVSGSVLFEIQGNSEFAQCDGNKIFPVEIIVPMLKLLHIEYDKIFLGNYPNPFKENTRISFYLPESGIAAIKLYNTIGEEVKFLMGKQCQSGWHYYNLNAQELVSGTYYCRLEFTGGSGNQSAMKVLSVFR